MPRLQIRNALGRTAPGVLAWGLAAAPALASPPWTHENITREELRRLGWTQDVEQVVRCNVATDLGRVNVVSRTLLRVSFPLASTHIGEVRALAATAPFNPSGTKSFHFNNLYRYDAVAGRWEEMDAWTRTVAERIAGLETEAERRELRVTLLGIVLHAVQDFYAHSNWIGILDRFTAGEMVPAEFPTWEELVLDHDSWRARHPQVDWDAALQALMVSNLGPSSDEEAGGLQTGRSRGEQCEGECPWKHRHKGGPERVVVEHLAARATAIWVRRLTERIENAGMVP
jgi:hypothetical protein